MSHREEEFLRRLRATFKVEADEHIRTISGGLVELERLPASPADAVILENIFRHAHSLKGAARALSLLEVESLCQVLEDVFVSARSGRLVLSPAHFDGLHEGIDLVTRLVVHIEAPISAEDRIVVRSVRQSLVAMVVWPGAGPAATPVTPDSSPPFSVKSARPLPAPERPASAPPFGIRTEPVSDTVRVAASKLDRLLSQAEELLAARQAAAQRATELREIEEFCRHLAERWTTDSRPHDSFADPERGDLHADEVVALQRRLHALRRAMARDHYAFGQKLNELLAETKALVMLPFGKLAEGFPKLVRDLSRAESKEVELVIRGGEVEMDKRVLEEIKDPLVHLLRNAVDHGVEPPAHRRAAGKPARAALTLTVLPAEGNRVEIRLADDGAGIDARQVREAAVREGVISPDRAAQLSEPEAISLIFMSALSTSPSITEVSGRGLGLAIVREKVNGLGGRVVVETRLGAGTTFRLILPATLATFRGMLVRTGGQVVVLPAANIEQAGRVRTDEVRTGDNRETVTLGGRVVPWARLDALLEFPPQAPRQGRGREYSSFVLVAADDERVAIGVDEVLHHEEVLVKRLVRPLSRVRNVAAATVLASGQVAVILNPSDLVKSARRARPGPADDGLAPSPARPRSILLVEDSTTSRMLLKNLFESDGYQVKIAADGLEAITTLQTEAVDLVVSDVEMPRLNGFDLTASIRADRRLAEKPVILVTALAKPADRQHGLAVGANAYLVKGSFEQDELLQTVHQLMP